MKYIMVKLGEIELVILMEALNHYERSSEFHQYDNETMATIVSLRHVLNDKLKIVCRWSFKYMINKLRSMMK